MVNKYVCGLPDDDRQRYVDKFKSLGIDKTSVLRFGEQSGRTIQLQYKMASTT